MFIPLLEKLIGKKITEIVALDLQKEVKAAYKGQSTKLKLSTFRSISREQDWYKFWLLTDGTMIPVTHSHRDTVRDAKTLVQHYFEVDPRKDFLEDGALAGHINNVNDELSIQSYKKLTIRQISQLKNLAIEYKVTSIVADIGKKDWQSDVKSSKHLDYLLNYGPMDEAVDLVPTVNPQKVLKDLYKGKSTKLTPSTWQAGQEGHELKFWLLTDGTIIPVESSHAETVEYMVDEDGHYYGRDFMVTGAIAGYVTDHTGEMGIVGNKNLTSRQVSQLKNIAIEYKATSVVVEVGRADFESPIDSSKHLDYLLKYGPMDESKDEEQIEKEQFFVDRTNKHIELVQGAAAKILDAYPEYNTEVLRDQIEVHDQSKLEEPERTPYIEITWRHKLEKEKGEYDPYNGKGYQTPGQLEKEEENKATVHHITTNSHHPEYHLGVDYKDANVDMDDRSESELIDASLMPPSDIIEMIADWQAMSEELQTNTAREWFDKQKGVRWQFTEEQEELIDKLLKVFEEEKG